MKSLKLLPHRTAVILMVAQGFSHGHALSQVYCSNENTGSDYNAVYNMYQSNGACQTTCQDSYAYAVVQYSDCWCSNYAPANQVSLSDCSQDCPGFPYEQCGNQDQGLYGYVALSISPSGTAGSSSSVASSTSSSQESTSTTQSSTEQSSTEQSSTEQSSTEQSSYSSSYVPTSTTSTTPISTTATLTYVPVVASSSETSSTVRTSQVTVTPRPVTSIQIVTLSGAMVTQTVTTTPAPFLTPDPDALAKQTQRKSVSGGTIAGAVVGSLAGLALLLLGAFLIWRRRQRKGDPESPKPMTRNASVLSKAGLLSSARAADAEKSYDDTAFAGGAAGVTSQRHSQLYAGAADNDSPVSAVGAGIYDLNTHDSRRNSRPLVYDQRLNPAALMHDNGSRTSINTMHDQRDYSRPLGVTNPDLHD